MLRKWNKREENLEFLIFWATMFLGGKQEEQLFLTKILFYLKKNFNIFLILLFATCAFYISDIMAETKTGSVFQDRD